MHMRIPLPVWRHVVYGKGLHSPGRFGSVLPGHLVVLQLVAKPEVVRPRPASLSRIAIHAKKKTWQESKNTKQHLKKDRQRHMRADGGGPDHRGTLSSKLKLVTRCGRCGERSRWHSECKNPPKTRVPSSTARLRLLRSRPGCRP